MINFISITKIIINLKKRSDRKANIIKSCAHYGFKNYDFFTAIEAETLNYHGYCSREQQACKLSHLSVLKKAKEDQLPYIAILEDDCEFPEFFNTKSVHFFMDVPKLWDMIYLGGQHKKKLHPITDKVATPTYLCSTHCYIVNNTAYDKLIKMLEDNDKPIDLIYVEHAQMKMNVYCAWPNLVLQSAGYSDVEKQMVDYKPFMNTVLNA